LNRESLRMEWFDPENEVWLEKPHNEIVLHQSLSVKIKEFQFQFQCDLIDSDHFFIWTRKNMEDRGILSIYNKDLQLVDTLPPVNLLVRYRKYSRIFSVGSNIILQTRYRPHRDTRQTVSDSTEDKELLHQEFDRYDNESYYSMLFYYHYDEKKMV